ncbi:MAG: HAMP domain-containing protein [Bacteroidetes bacterium]|nr:MAG: HAMP domain-containing protein [Bacteroidota bacterium]
MKIGQKLQLYVLLVTGLIFVLAIGYISLKNRDKALRDTATLVDTYAANYAENISNSFNADMAVVRTLAQVFYVNNFMPVQEWKPLFVKMYRQVFENNPHFYALWDSWEYTHVRPNWNLPHGRFLNYHFWENGEIGYQELERSLDGDPPLYNMAKESGREMIWEPYPDQLVEGATTSTLMTTFTVPMFHNNRYVGLVGLDIALTSLQQMISDIRPFEGSYAFLVSHDGLYAAHPVTQYLEQPIAKNLEEDDEEFQILERIKAGDAFSFISNREKSENFYYSFAPVYVGETRTPWSMGMAVPVKHIREEARSHFVASILIGLAGLIIIGFIIRLVSLSISKPIKKLTLFMKRLARGEIDKSMKLEISTGDELQEMSEAFNTSIGGLLTKTNFALDIGKGDLDARLALLSDEDVLGRSMLEMQDDLKKARDEEEARKEENKIRTWASEGYAKFSEILRNNNDDLEELSFDVIKNLVKYLDANQGGLFVLNDEDAHNKFLELKGCYAYDRKKYLEKVIQPGEGLVGTCFLEGKTTYITDIPESYIRITSGLGDSNPGALIIVPMKYNERVYGVIEIASFHEFTPWQMEFIEKIGESLASTLSSVKTNLRTTALLEVSQQQAEEMKAQEEEMRQNMEELHATQEEIARKAAEMQGILNALDSSSYIIEYDLSKRIINISDSYLKLLKLSRNEVLGTHHSEKLEFTPEQKKEYEKFWDDIMKGKIKHQKIRVNVNGKIFWLDEIYAPIFNQNGNVYKIFKIAHNITDTIHLTEKYEEEIGKLKEKMKKLHTGN